MRLASPELGGEELAAIGGVLESGMLVKGREVEAFEREVAARRGRAHAVAVSSGTAALELALRALGIDRGEVLVPDLRWPSPAHAVAMIGARPVLVDDRADEWSGDVAGLAAGRGAATRTAIVIDHFGLPARHLEIARGLERVARMNAHLPAGGATPRRPSRSLGFVPAARLGLGGGVRRARSGRSARFDRPESCSGRGPRGSGRSGASRRSSAAPFSRSRRPRSRGRVGLFRS